MSKSIDKIIHKTNDLEEITLRPATLKEYIGQNHIISNLTIYIGAALNRNQSIDHILLYGPPGLGKTTLANVIANEMKSNLHVCSGPSIEKSSDLYVLLSELLPGDILFIDEIHRLPLIVEESLYSAMEDYKFTIMINRENVSKSISIDLPPFTLIGATTKIGNLSSPLRSRFGIIEKIEYYTSEELCQIVKRTAKVYNYEIDNQGAYEIAKRSRGTPRIANNIFKRVRDYADYEQNRFISYDNVMKALNNLNIDEIGLDKLDKEYLNALIKRFNGNPVGLLTLANSIGEEPTTLEDVVEPYLLKLGFIDRTSKGRVATIKAYEHLKIIK